MGLKLEAFLDSRLKLFFFILDPLVDNPHLPVQITGFLFQFCSDFLQGTQLDLFFNDRGILFKGFYVLSGFLDQKTHL